MNQLRSMPDREKYQRAFGMVQMYRKHVLPFVERQLGYAARHELNSVWQAAIIPIRKEDPDEKKYADAYSNWLWMARCSHDFLADLLDRQGVADYKRLILKLYQQQQDNSDLAVMRLFKRYASLARAWAYEMQWLTPIVVADISWNRVTCLVQNCKIMQTPATERVCKVDCRNVGSALVRKVYHIKRQDTIADHSCMIRLTPVEN